MNDFFAETLKIISGHAKGKHNEIYRKGFYLGLGVFGGVLLNDLWRILNLPGNNKPTLIATGELGPKPQVKKDTPTDELYQRIIALAVVGSSIIFDFDDALPLGSGLYIGIDLANRSERGEYVGFV